MELADLDLGSTDKENIKNYRESAARETPSGLANQYSEGTEQARGLLQPSNQFNQQLGGQDDSMLAAVRTKYNRQANMGMEKIKNQNQMAAQGDHLKKLETATQLASQELELNRQKSMLEHKMKQQRKAMRGQIMGTVLGIAGGVAGGFATMGSPVGIMAGAQMGQGAGQMAGSQ